MNAALKPVVGLWRRLTSMRTALILLFLLAVAAVPGSLLPQRSLNPSKVTSYIKQHGWWGRLLDRTDMFDVFGSPWFAAIYLLLFVSLVGCLIPRIRVHARAMTRKPLAAPRVLSRLPESTSFQTPAVPSAYVAAARETLGRRWRIAERTEDSGALTISAEKGYSRETGNLIFHVALLVALVLIAIGRLYTYEGTKIVDQGQGLCNSAGNYDDWRPGRLASEGKITPVPFCITDVNKFVATYSKTGEPREFAADVSYQASGKGAGSPTQHATIKVNHPLRLEGDRVYLTGHGFAPTVTIRLPDGTVQHVTSNFLPSDATTLYSQGVFTATAANPNRSVGISAFFAPTPSSVDGKLVSASPAVKNPALGLQVFVGNLNQTGQPRSVFTFDQSRMKQLTALPTLRIGQTAKLPDGIRVRFDGWTPWVDLQVSHDPTQSYLLVAALAMVLGLGGSLAVRRRRLWLRVTAPDDGPTLVRVGGLARSDSGNFTAEFAGLVDRLKAAGTSDQSSAAPPDDTFNRTTDHTAVGSFAGRAGKD